MSPLLREVPLELRTQRLLLRCPRAGDGPVVHQAIVESLAALRAWPASLPWAMVEPKVEASELFCRRGQAEWLARTNFPMLVFLLEDGRYVGGSGLHRPDWSVPSFELGYWCHAAHGGRGLASEAAQAVLQFGFDVLGARRITSLPDEANQPSRRVAERAGMALEGVMRNERIGPDGTPRHTCLYAITR